MIRRTPQLASGYLVRLALASPDSSPDPAVSYAGYGRTCLFNLFRLLGIGVGDRVLLPAYICDVVVLPCAELGIEPVYYAITDDFKVAWDSVRVQPGTRAIITVNYFGFSQDYSAVETFAQQHGLIWINDNAHGFASCHGDTPLERFGDISVTSFRKVIPVRNGASVRFNSDTYRGLREGFELLCREMPKEPRLRYAAGALLHSFGISVRRLPDFSSITAFADDDMRRYRIDSLALKLLTSSNTALIRKRRRDLYIQIGEIVAHSGIDSMAPVSNLFQEGNSPLVFPVIVTDRTVWLNILRRSRETGLDIHTWPSLPAAVIKTNCCNAVEQWRKFVFLPVHQDIDATVYLPLLSKVLHVL